MSTPSTPRSGQGWSYPTPGQPLPAPRVVPTSGPHGSRPGPGQPRPRRTGLMVGLIIIGVAVALAVVAALVVVRTVVEPQTLSSANGVVTMQVPGTWDDLTSPDAGQPYTTATEEDQWTVPDLEAENFLGDAHLSVWVSDASDGYFTTVQKEVVEDTCDTEGCLSRGTPTSVTVAGHSAVQRLLRHPASKDYGSSSTLVVSLIGSGTVVSIAIWWDDLVDLDTAKLLRSVVLTR